MANRNYNMYDGIDFSMFEPKQGSYERNAARKIETTVVPVADKPKMELVNKPKKTLNQVKREMHASALQSAKIIAISIFLLSMLSALLYGRIKVDELDRQISAAETKITTAQSENVRLNMQLDSMISLKNVEEYAQTNLGMVKMESYQIEYIDLSGADKVMVSGARTLNANSTSLYSKIMEYMSR